MGQPLLRDSATKCLEAVTHHTLALVLIGSNCLLIKCHTNCFRARSTVGNFRLLCGLRLRRAQTVANVGCNVGIIVVAPGAGIAVNVWLGFSLFVIRVRRGALKTRT